MSAIDKLEPKPKAPAQRSPGPTLMPATRSLFEPLRLGGLTLANRIAVSPMCQYSAENGAANDWHLQHLGSLSVSGAGLVIVEQTAVEPIGQLVAGGARCVPAVNSKKASARGRTPRGLERLRALRSEWLLVAPNAAFESTPSNGEVGWFAVVPAYSRTEPAALRSPVCVRRLR